MLSVTDAVNTVAALPHKMRTRKVNELLMGLGDGQASETMQWNALFVTALREREVWPQGCH